LQVLEAHRLKDVRINGIGNHLTGELEVLDVRGRAARGRTGACRIVARILEALLPFHAQVGKMRMRLDQLAARDVVRVRRQRDRGEDRDDRDHDHQFDECEALTAMHGSPLST